MSVFLENDNELSLITDSLPAFIAFVDSQQRYRFVNSAYVKHFGLPRDQIWGLTVRELNGTKEYEKSRADIEKALAGTPVKFEYLKTGDPPLQYQMNYIPRFEFIEPENGSEPVQAVTGYYVIATDVTDFKKVEAALKSSRNELKTALEQVSKIAHFDRISSINETASAIAHELNQPLTIVANDAFSLRVEAQKKQIDRQALIGLSQRIVDQALNAGEIVHRIRRYVSKSDNESRAIKINQIISDSHKILEPKLSEMNVGIELILDDDLPLIQVQPVQIQQVFVNLILNAAESFADTQSDNRMIHVVSGKTEDGFVFAEVRDNGAGITAETRPHIFEPFFTTKNTGMGVGLSISQSYGIVQEHGGWISVKSDVGQGSCFSVYLPKSVPAES